jgi:hypothetical protein
MQACSGRELLLSIRVRIQHRKILLCAGWQPGTNDHLPLEFLICAQTVEELDSLSQTTGYVFAGRFSTLVFNIQCTASVVLRYRIFLMLKRINVMNDRIFVHKGDFDMAVEQPIRSL